MRLLLLCAAWLSAAPLAAGQPQIHPADRSLGRIGFSLGPGDAGGLSIFSPNVGYSTTCYSGDYDPYYDCGSYAVAFLVDGEYEYDLLSSHTLFFSPSSTLDPYVTGYAGFGYGDEAGFVYGGEIGLNLWITETGGLTLYAGRVNGERQRYSRVGIGLVFDTGGSY